MRAWQFVGTHKAFERVDIEEPRAGSGKVVIDVKAAGLCHSDVGILEDEKWLATMKELPVVPGHETAGVISEVGEGVTDWKVGDRVAVWPMAELMGYMVNGAWEDRAEVSTDALIAIPDEVSFAQAAAATDAGMTSVGALSTAGVEAGMKVGIIGFGGLGQIGARVAKLRGADVYVAEVNESIWDRVREAGATRVAKSITEFADVELDVIIDYAGFGVTTADALQTVKSSGGGRVVQVGMGRLESTIDTYALILGRKQIFGSMGGSKDDIVETMRHMASGDLQPAITEIDFEEIPAGIQQLMDGTSVGRLVAKVAD
jgi:alcohol dehydrogenase, propanol-preferring